MKKLLHLAGGASKQAVRTATAPASHVFDEEVRRTQESTTNRLSDFEVKLLAATSLVATVLAAMTLFMQFSKYAAIDAAELKAYHPTTSWFRLAAASLLGVGMYVKGIRYWLAYVPIAWTLIGSTVFLLLLHGHLTPEDFQVFDFGPTWWQGR